jgi:carboxymethylenebutenolidase
MILADGEFVDLPTPTGAMRTHLFRPRADGRYPGVLFYSEIFQVTAPIRRMAALIAGHGYVVAVPEIYHEFEPPGRVLAYDPAGTDRGNALKRQKELPAVDGDARAVLDHLHSHGACTGRLGAFGICIGGHLAFRAGAKQQDVLAAACFYATDLHSATLGRAGDDTLASAGNISGELLLVWGRQDPHIPVEGRRKIHDALAQRNVDFTWLEVNAQHAFLRDEGSRYDAALALQGYAMTLDLFHRRLG